MKPYYLFAVAAIVVALGVYATLHTSTARNTTVSILASTPFSETTSQGEVHKHAQGNEVRTLRGAYTVPSDMWVTEFSATPHDASFDAIESIIVAEPGKADALCPNRQKLLWSVDTTTAKEPRPIPPPYGIFLKKDTQVEVTATLIGEPHPDAAVEVHMATEPAGKTTRTKQASYHIVTPSSCTQTPEFEKLLAGTRATYNSSKTPFVFPSDGTMLGARAHFHSAAYPSDGVIRLFFNDETAESFATASITDKASRNRRIFVDKTPLSIKRGDTLSMVFDTNAQAAAAPDENTLFLCFYYATE